jgi:glycosyltransferase involved in cell wall biosynthesis
MKVLHIAPSIARSYGGPTQSLVGYVIAGQRLGIDVSIAAPTPGAGGSETPDDAAAFADNTEGASLELFRSFGNGAFATSPSLVRWASRNAKRFDVVHVHGLFNPISSLAARACIRMGNAVIIRPFGTLSRYTFAHRRTALKRVYFSLLERRNITHAAGIHFTTATEKQEAKWRGLSFDQRAYIVPPPFIDDAPRPDAVDSVNPAPDKPTVLFLGRLNRVKNIEALLEAWPAVHRHCPGARLAVAGSGDQRYLRELRQLAHRLGINGDVRFAGIVSGHEKERLLHSASVVVLPSLHENFGMVVLEAVAAGAPVVVSPDVQLAPFVRDSGLGMVADPEPATLAAAITATLGDAELKGRVRRTGRATVAKSFSPEVVGRLLLDMYLGALDHSSRKTSPAR